MTLAEILMRRMDAVEDCAEEIRNLFPDNHLPTEVRRCVGNFVVSFMHVIMFDIDQENNEAESARRRKINKVLSSVSLPGNPILLETSDTANDDNKIKDQYQESRDYYLGVLKTDLEGQVQPEFWVLLNTLAQNSTQVAILSGELDRSLGLSGTGINSAISLLSNNLRGPKYHE
jgi:hypothetical protein